MKTFRPRHSSVRPPRGHDSLPIRTMVAHFVTGWLMITTNQTRARVTISTINSAHPLYSSFLFSEKSGRVETLISSSFSHSNHATQSLAQLLLRLLFQEANEFIYNGFLFCRISDPNDWIVSQIRHHSNRICYLRFGSKFEKWYVNLN